MAEVFSMKDMRSIETSVGVEIPFEKMFEESDVEI